MSTSIPPQNTDSAAPAPGEWTTTGDVPAGFNPTSSVSSGGDSDCSYTEYSWSFGGTAPFFENVFSATLNTQITLNGQVVGIAVSSDDNATVSIAGIGGASSTLHNSGSACFFKTDGSSYSGAFSLHITFNTIGGPWGLNVRIRAATPKEPVPAEEECLCKYGACGMASSARSGSVDFSQPFGGTPFAAGFPKGALKIYDRIPVAKLFSGSGLRYVHPMTRRVKSVAGTTVVIEDALHRAYSFENGRPAGTAIWTDNRVEILSDGRIAETLPDRTRITYDASGNAEKIRSSDGVELTRAQLGIEIIYDENGDLAQVWSLTDGLAEVEKISAMRFRLNWHKPSDIGAKDAETGRYTHAGTPIKTFLFGDVDEDGDCSMFELQESRTGTEFSYHYSWQYDTDAKDWVFVRGNAAETSSETSRKEKTFLEDESGARFAQIKEWKRAGTGAETLVSTEKYSYGDTGEMLVARSAGTTSEYSATRVLSGNGTGKIASETDRAGALRTYDYDAQGRMTRETLSIGFGGNAETKDYTYASAGTGFVDFRPRSITHKIAGTLFSQETFSYDDDFANGRTETHSVSSAGTTLSSETRYYSSTSGTVGAGRVKLEIRADGTATFHEYSATAIPANVDVSSDLGYAETITEGVFENDAFATVPAKSTRVKKFFDTRGNETRTENYVHTGTAFELISWENKTYSPAHKIISSEKSDGKTSSADYICTGAVWTIDEDGVRTDNTFDSAKRLATSTRRGARGDVVTTYGYDAESRIISETQTAGTLSRTTSRAFNALGELLSETDALGNATTFSHSADGLTETATFADGGTRITVRNAHGETLSITGTAVVSQYFSYAFDAENALKITTVFTGTQNSPLWEKTYTDAHGRIVKTERPGFGENVILTTENTYAGTRLVSVVSTGQPTTTYAHDALGNVISTTLAAGTQTRTVASETIFSNENGVIYRVTTNTVSCSDASVPAQTTLSKTRLSSLSPALESEEISIDVRGNATTTASNYNLITKTRTRTTTFPHATGTRTETFVDGALVSKNDLGNVSTASGYDAFDRKISDTDARGNATTYAYDAGDRIISQTRILGAETSVTQFAYDAMNSPVRTTFADGSFVANAYDLRGNKIAEYGNASYPVKFTFDAQNRKTRMETFRTLAGTPEDLANLTNGDATLWNYDSATGLLLSKTDALGAHTNYNYTAAGLLASRTWARGITTSYAHDAWNQLAGTAYSDATPGVSQTYDALGRTVSVSDAAGTRTFAYDAYGAVSSETQSATGTTLTFARDSHGRETSATLKRGATLLGISARSYDAASGRLSGASFGGIAFVWNYLAGTNFVSSLTIADGAVMTKTLAYTAGRNLISSIAYANADGDLIAKRDYGYDALDRVISRVQTRGNGESATTRTDAFGYNSRSELTSATLGNAAYAYAFDHIGNRATASEAGTQLAYAANALNQYATITETEAFTPTYDADGNATSVKTATGTWSVSCNGENRPVRFENAGTQTVVECGYDSLGRRFEKKVTVAGTLVLHERYAYRGYLQIAAFDVAGTQEPALKRVIYWDPTEETATRPLAISIVGDNVYFPTVDLTKNVCELVDFYGNVAATYDYAPFGNVSAGTPSGTAVPANPLQWSSEIYDSELDLVYYNYRHYSPALGRFLSRDPIEERGGLNLYAFCGNNSLKQVDYLGQAAPGIDISIAIRDLIDLINSTRVDNGAAHSYCERYSRYIDATCCRDGVEEQDNYVLKARNMCHDFVNMYSKNGKVIEAVECVAKCLSDAEDESMKISSCEDRNSLRLINHVKCYASCGFFLTDMRYEIGTPPGGWDMGFNEMLPDFIKSLKKRYF